MQRTTTTHNHDHARPRAHARPPRGAHRPHEEPVVLEIGERARRADRLHRRALLHQEIEISPAGDDDEAQPQGRARARRRRALVLRGRVRPDPRRQYTLWLDGHRRTRGATVAGGTIAELDWTS